MRQSNALRFSLRTLLIAVACVAVGCTALLNANEWWAAGLWTVYAVLYSLAILVAIFRPGATRAACLGFAIWGAVFFSLSFQKPHGSPFVDNPITDIVFDLLWPMQQKPGPPYDPFDNWSLSGGAPVNGEFHVISGALWLLLVSTIGGWVAWHLYRTAPHADAAQEKPHGSH